jgi:hypothetical protein
MTLFAGTAFAAEEFTPELAETAPSQELYPADVQTITGEGSRQIIKTYILSPEQNPSDIPRAAFTRDGWRYTLTDVTERKIIGTETRTHTETAEINTDSNDLNEIIKLLSPTLEYQSEDGFAGTLTLDLASVTCEPAGYKNSGFTVTATREYPRLSSADTSLIPKTVTENGRTLELSGVEWLSGNTETVDYNEFPQYYTAVAKYTADGYKTVVTGYVTTAEYSGKLVKSVTGDTVYTAYFEGVEVNPPPKPTVPPTPTATAEPSEQSDSVGSSIPLLTGIAALAALLAGGGVFLFLRHNVKVYGVRSGSLVLLAKVRIGKKNPVIDITPLTGKSENNSFRLEIDKLSAKSLNNATIEVVYGSASLKHAIAYEGGAYKIDADFRAGTIKAVY